LTKLPNGIVQFTDDKPLIHYGLIRFQEVVIQQYSQIVKEKKLLITVIVKDSKIGSKRSQKFTTPKKKGYYLIVERAFLSLVYLNSALYHELPDYFQKDFRLSSWEDILDFFQSSDEFNTWIEGID
jgi:hypothetical protein